MEKTKNETKETLFKTKYKVAKKACTINNILYPFLCNKEPHLCCNDLKTSAKAESAIVQHHYYCSIANCPRLETK